MPPRKRPPQPALASAPAPEVNPRLAPPPKLTAPAPARASAPAPAAAAADQTISDAIVKNLPGPEREVYKLVLAAGNMGMWIQELRKTTGLANNTLTKHTRTLVSKGVLREVLDVRQRSKKIFMAAGIEPSPEITGGTWYHDGQLDSDAVAAARRRCLDQVDRLGLATADMIYDGVHKEHPRAGHTIEQIREIVRTMVLDRVLEECRSTGVGEFDLIRAGRVCYRRGGAPQGGMMEGIPCGVCPRIDECSPDGVISPTTCVYYKKWLQMDF